MVLSEKMIQNLPGVNNVNGGDDVYLILKPILKSYSGYGKFIYVKKYGRPKKGYVLKQDSRWIKIRNNNYWKYILDIED